MNHVQPSACVGAGLMLLLIGSTCALAQNAKAPATTLRQAAGERMLVGAAIMSQQLVDPRLAELIAAQFNCLTAENEMKPGSLQPRKGEFTFDNADKIVAFAQAHDMRMIGHNLCWHAQTPAWMFADETKKPLPREQALA